MGTSEFIAIATGIILGALHYFSENLELAAEPKRFRIISFGAGISIAYLFLHLLPHTYEAAIHLEEWVFLFLLLGFALFHLSEKYVYQHIRQEKRAKELKEIHSIIFFVYHFTVGIVIADLFQAEILEGFLFVIPVALHVGVSTISLSKIHGEIRESVFIKVILSLSTLLGVVFALLIHIPDIVNNILVSFIAGVLLYIIVKEFLPEKEKGKPLFFIFGLLLFCVFSIVLFMSR
jgi:zinc transporter ZupT